MRIIPPSPSLLPSSNRETTSAENFPLWSRKEKTPTTKTSELHADFEKVLSSSPGLESEAEPSFHHSFITATLEDFGLNILYKCHKAEEHIKLKL